MAGAGFWVGVGLIVRFGADVAVAVFVTVSEDEAAAVVGGGIVVVVIVVVSTAAAVAGVISVGVVHAGRADQEEHPGDGDGG